MLSNKNFISNHSSKIYIGAKELNDKYQHINGIAQVALQLQLIRLQVGKIHKSIAEIN